MLAELLLHPETKLSITQVAQRIEAPKSVIAQEAARLVEAQVLRDERVGRTRLVQANPDYRLAAPLTQILAATFGPVPVLTRMFAGLAGMREAYIYGSWAARFQGTPGRAPGDVDVLVVGSPDRAALNEIAATAEQELGLPVQITKVSPDAWARATEPFIQTVKDRPLIRLAVEGQAQ
jgi:predicted nucleotidyltransferase